MMNEAQLLKDTLLSARLRGLTIEDSIQRIFNTPTTTLERFSRQEQFEIASMRKGSTAASGAPSSSSAGALDLAHPVTYR